MRTWLLALLVTPCLACGGAAVEGTWLLREVMSHRCRTVADLGLACEDDSTLDPGYREGIVQIQDLGGQRLRLIDVDGRTTIGRAYADGARFAWFERNNRDAGACVEDSSEVVELLVDGDGLGGQRRIQTAHSDGCGSQGSSDLGYALSASSVEVLR